MVWQGAELRVPYAYGLSDALDDLLDMLEVLEAPAGSEWWLSFSPAEPGELDADWSLLCRVA